MLIMGRNDLANRISPRLYDFHTQLRKEDEAAAYTPGSGMYGQHTQGIVSWRKNHYTKDYCQSQKGYTCQRPAASMYGADGSGNLAILVRIAGYLRINACISMRDYYLEITMRLFSAYHGCFSESVILAKNQHPVYESVTHMKLGFCIQVCIGLGMQPNFFGVSVSNNVKGND